MEVYNYTISDFSNGINLDRLEEELRTEFLEYKTITQKGVDIIIAFETAIDKTTLDTIISNHNGEPLPIDLIKTAYNQYKEDGSNFFNDFRASLVYDYKTGIKTDVEIFEIEDILFEVTNKLISGDWMSAKYKLSLITTSGAFTQEIKDYLMNEFTEYITNNY